MNIKGKMPTLTIFNAYWKVLKKKAGLIKIPPIIKTVRKNGLSYLGEGALYDLHKQVSKIEKSNIPGIIIEAGCALGGSAIVIADAKNSKRPFKVYDVFGMIPPPTEEDGADIQKRFKEILDGNSNGIDGNKYYGYRDDLLSEVKINFSEMGLEIEENNIELIEGKFEDTLFVKDQVALAHIDSDWYQSVLTCLQRIVPKLAKGGIIAVDDYYCWSGCKKAVDEYFADKKEKFIFRTRERLFIELK